MSMFVLSSPAAWLLWFIVLTVAMYFARLPAHRAILSLTRALHHSMRLATHSLRLAEQKLAARNREVLLAAGREAKERIIEREFERIDASVRRDLSECPALHRRLTEQATKLEEDHDQSKAVPLTPPGWVKAVKAVAEIDAKGDPMVAEVLGSINESMAKAQERAREEHRAATKDRHLRLKAMLASWRNAVQLLDQVDGR
jgi:hypothetical protein